MTRAQTSRGTVKVIRAVAWVYVVGLGFIVERGEAHAVRVGNLSMAERKDFISWCV
jgi:hypothetical protein